MDWKAIPQIPSNLAAIKETPESLVAAPTQQLGAANPPTVTVS